MTATLLWLRRDLRLSDNPALLAAAKRGHPVIPVYIHDDTNQADGRAAGAASLCWLYGSLRSLGRALGDHGSALILRSGHPLDVLKDLCRETGSDAIFWSQTFDPAQERLDQSIKAWGNDQGITCKRFNANLLFPPGSVKNKAGASFRVFTPFWKACMTHEEPKPPQAAPDNISAPALWPDGNDLDDWALRPKNPNWSEGIFDVWTPGEAGALGRLESFLDEHLQGYKKNRDVPSRPATSKLSPHLHFGEISPRTIWHQARTAGLSAGLETDLGHFLSEMGWREFSHDLLNNNPQMATEPLQPKFKAFPWAENNDDLRAWQQGQTGIPIVDAGMRELWQTGWMHNRVRMIVASFLVKNLMQPWQAGEAWFWDCLVDADPANNPAGWQWVAGCGADAAPFFRIFNPVTQGERFDANGDYVRRFVPELTELPNKFIHHPWDADDDTLKAAKVALGETYPKPLVSLKASREEALEAFKAIKNA